MLAWRFEPCGSAAPCALGFSSLGDDAFGLFTPDINALVALVLGLTAAMCILAVRHILPREMADEIGD